VSVARLRLIDEFGNFLERNDDDLFILNDEHAVAFTSVDTIHRQYRDSVHIRFRPDALTITSAHGIHRDDEAVFAPANRLDRSHDEKLEPPEVLVFLGDLPRGCAIDSCYP